MRPTLATTWTWADAPTAMRTDRKVDDAPRLRRRRWRRRNEHIIGVEQVGKKRPGDGAGAIVCDRDRERQVVILADWVGAGADRYAQVSLARRWRKLG